MQKTPVQFEEACRQLIEIGGRVHARGWAPATSGNYSIRTGAERLAITQSGRDKAGLKPADVMELGMDGTPLTPGEPSAESGLHRQLYRRDRGIGAVLHSHSLNAVLVSTHCLPAKERVIALTGLELLKAFTGIDSHQATVTIPVFENDQDIGALAAAVDAHMNAHGLGVAYLIRGHGAYTWGRDLAECYRHLEALEFLLEYLWRTAARRTPNDE